MTALGHYRGPKLLLAFFVLYFFARLTLAVSPRKAIASVYTNTDGAWVGTAYFAQPDAEKPITIYGAFNITAPDSIRGVHIHQWGDMSNGCDSTGPHLNPLNTTHGSPTDTTRPRHAGDLGNIQSNSSGIAILSLTLPDLNLTLFGDPYSSGTAIGSAIVIHAGSDDLGLNATASPNSTVTGTSGTRFACGAIQKSPT